jgi:uncharacterized oligopeptide transporter (OPT) family protein
MVALAVIVLHHGEAATGGLGGSELPAPQAVLMKLVVDGVLDHNLPWHLILIGAAIAGVVALLRVPVLPFAVGVYLPMYTMAAVFLGGFMRWWLSRGMDKDEAERRREQGVLVGSGMVGGEGLTGVLFAVWVVTINRGERILGYPVGDMLTRVGWSSTGVAIVDGVLAAGAIGVILGLIAFFAKRQVSARG